MTSINGSIPNLPDGTMYMWEEGPPNKIDSAKTHHGNFKITHEWIENKEPNIIGLYHIDKSGVKRFFTFATNANYNGTPGWSTNAFYADTVISLNGKFKEDLPTAGYKLPYNIKDVSGVSIKGGRQTAAFYHTDGNLFSTINDHTIQIIQAQLNKYPYSYHLLYQIIANKNNFSAPQVDEFLKSFKGDITESESYKQLSAYNLKRFTAGKNPLAQIEAVTGKKSDILDKKFEKHLIIFWASWCAPCRAEIPLLKKMHNDKKSNVEFVSVSIDDDKNAWKKAVHAEQMPWKQFILEENTPAFENYQMRFKLNSAIPYTILVDNQLKILAASTGLGTGEELKKLLETK